MLVLSRIFSIIAVISCFTAVSFAQISQGGAPYSFSKTLNSDIPTVSMPPVDIQAYLNEDALADKDEPYRFGANIDVALNLEKNGIWEEVENGGRIWRLRVQSSNAYSISLLYDKWNLPKGATLFIYNDARDRVIGAFTDFNNWIDGTNITSPVADDAVILELYEPAEVRGQSQLSISSVVHAYRNVFGRPERDGRNPLDNYGTSGACNNNINCPEGTPWQIMKRGVTMILTSGGSRICTGSMINNTSNNGTPYFLTANHCLGGNNTWQFMFNYESPLCSPQSDGPTNQTVSNSTLRANWSTSDFALLQLSASPPANYNAIYNGWNRVNAGGDSSVCIHHPDGDIKKISFDYGTRTTASWSGNDTSHWRIASWEDGTTEPGSSGSPLFDKFKRIVGQLHGGDANCSNNVNDYYGKFSRSWTGNGTNATRLSNWLDPTGTGATTLDYYDPNGATISITVGAPNGGETWIIGDANNITWSSVNVTGNVNIQLNRSYSGGGWENVVTNTANDGSYSWTVTGAATSAARVRIISVDNPAVGDTSNANFTIGSRSLSVSAPNGGENWIVGDVNNITWSSANLTGNVNIQLNRNFSVGAWEDVVLNTANDGTHAWTVTSPITSAARIRVISASFPAVGDTSNANFTIGSRTISVTAPNGSETWVVGDINNITWSSANLTGNVNIQLNRSYPSLTWEDVILNTANDGTHAWTVSGAVTSTARIRVTSVSFPTVSDSSNANFNIATRTLTLLSPNGEEFFPLGSVQNITWTSTNLTGNVSLELNRSYSGGPWEPIVSNIANSGTYAWTVTNPVTGAARVRVTSVNFPSLNDISNQNFTIYNANTPPAIAHDFLDDQPTEPFNIVAYVTDDVGGFAVTLFYRAVGAGSFTSLPMTFTGNPAEYSASLNFLADGKYEYYIYVMDAGALSAQTVNSFFDVFSSCGTELSYDDGSAESSHWSARPGFAWAVKFSPAQFPYALCAGRVGISALHPASVHTNIKVQVLLADGLGGFPGTVIYTDTTGSIGNILGGIPVNQDNWADLLFRDALGNPLLLSGEFYIAVSNPDSGKYESFLHDTLGVFNNRSYVFDPCDGLWYSESSGDTSARHGNRMIRVSGFTLLPPVITVIRNNNDIQLDWTAMPGVPYYHIYSSTVSDGPFTTHEGSTASNSFLDLGAVSESIKFYVVKSSIEP